MNDGVTWRDFLKDVISSVEERQRIAAHINVDVVTLLRWTKGGTRPRMQALKRLPEAFPGRCEYVRELIRKEYSELFVDDKEKNSGEYIPLTLYQRVLQARTHTSPQLLFATLCDLILDLALKQLDPRRIGLGLFIFGCIPPTPDRQTIRSLRLLGGRGTTAPWLGNLEENPFLLGQESITGIALSSGVPQWLHDFSDPMYLLPGYQINNFSSGAASPILQMGKVAGVLTAISTQERYFIPERLRLLEHYAHLIALAFHESKFYPREIVALQILPEADKQRPIVMGLWQRVISLINVARQQGKLLLTHEAEQQVWQEIEEELIELARNGM